MKYRAQWTKGPDGQWTLGFDPPLDIPPSTTATFVALRPDQGGPLDAFDLEVHFTPLIEAPWWRRCWDWIRRNV